MDVLYGVMGNTEYEGKTLRLSSLDPHRSNRESVGGVIGGRARRW